MQGSSAGVCDRQALSCVHAALGVCSEIDRALCGCAALVVTRLIVDTAQSCPLCASDVCHNNITLPTGLKWIKYVGLLQ
jgi:hypothetical protein